jgi:hypothetical protein
MKTAMHSPMAGAFIKAVHKAIDSGKNTGRVGRVVLTNEAAGVGQVKIYRKTKNKITAVSAS